MDFYRDNLKEMAYRQFPRVDPSFIQERSRNEALKEFVTMSGEDWEGVLEHVQRIRDAKNGVDLEEPIKGKDDDETEPGDY